MEEDVSIQKLKALWDRLEWYHLVIIMLILLMFLMVMIDSNNIQACNNYYQAMLEENRKNLSSWILY